ncbi:MAG: hypothetical protein J2P24_21100 [Streptosporangiales bacterium]|nr:hypothetical protein [Streptosporangiales bacterium]
MVHGTTATQHALRQVRYGLRSARSEVAALVRTASRVREQGPEREQLIQSGKSAGAALLAWVVAAYLLNSPVALMAPWVALVLVQATVYRSVLKGVQQLVAIAVGAVFALAVQLAVGNTLIALAISLPVMLLLGQWRHFGAEGIYGATTVLFVLAYGPRSCSEPTTSASEPPESCRTTGSWEIEYCCIRSIAAPTFWCDSIVTSSGSSGASWCLKRSTSRTFGVGSPRSRKPSSIR